MKLTKREKEKILHGLVRAYDVEELELFETRKDYPGINYSNKPLIEFSAICQKLATAWGYEFLRRSIN